MEIQKNLFKLSEKILLSRNTKSSLQTLFIFSLTLTLVSFTVFIIGIEYFPQGKKVTELNNILETEDSIIHVVIKDFDSITDYPMVSGLYYQDKEKGFLIYKNTLTNFSRQLLFSYSFNILTLNTGTLQKNKFTNYTLLIDQPHYFTFEKNILGKYQLLVNQLIQNPYLQKQRLQIQLYDDFYYFRRPVEHSKVFVLIKCFIGILILSAISLIYIYGTIISAPAFLIFLIQILKIDNTLSRLGIYKVFPWIGIYMHPLDRRDGDRPITSKFISRAFIFSFFLIYLIYFGVIIGLRQVLFLKSIRQTMNENYYGFVALVQFTSLLFFRTRTTIKYFPSSFILIQLAFLYYCSTVQFGYKNWFLAFNICFSICLLIVFIIKIQIPSQLSWNKQMPYTPSENRPRSLYIPSYNMMWMNDMPDFWTLLVPPVGRQAFLQEQLAFVDQEYETLANIMRQE